ncbi:MAG: hypothetical protein J6K51_02830 [Clostridia bacterium]|nr:hypothetical protein [Clostridia bacterium]
MKEIKYGVLLDFYGDLLTKKQREALDLYYNEDYSLLEIGEHLNISRQGVFECIKKGAEHLEHYEDILRLYEKNLQTESVKEELKQLLSKCDDTLLEQANELIDKL